MAAQLITRRPVHAGKPWQLCCSPALAVGLLLALATSVPADSASWTKREGDIEITCSLSNDNPQVAEGFALEISVLAPPDHSVAFPVFGQQLGRLDILADAKLWDVPLDRGRLWSMRLDLESIRAGNLDIPPIEIRVSNAKDTRLLSTQPIALRVASSLEDRADPGQFRDIQSVVDVPLPGESSNIWPLVVLLTVVACCLAGTAAWVLTRRRRELTPHQWANSQLSALEQSAQASQAEGAELISALSEVLRDYLQLRFIGLSKFQTSQEVIDLALQQRKISQPAAAQLTHILNLADDVKFAGLDVGRDETLDAVRAAQELIRLVETEAAKTEGGR